MDSSMIGKIAKAKRYAAEANDRLAFDQFRATVKGDNSTHRVTYESGRWSCDCRHFETHRLCSHTMTLERVLGSMLQPQIPESPIPRVA